MSCVVTSLLTSSIVPVALCSSARSVGERYCEDETTEARSIDSGTWNAELLLTRVPTILIGLAGSLKTY